MDTLNLRYFEKATKSEKIFHRFLNYFKKFVTSLEYLNFTAVQIIWYNVYCK